LNKNKICLNVFHFYLSRNAFPSHKFIGEETTADSDGLIKEFGNDPTWIIDPIDGTMNFVHSHPLVSISVGLVINKRIIIGIVFAPVIDKMYTAIKGKGAFLNGKPMKV
jgi:inositol-phosphate phosphatase/L-galactose 1-phosphate phosphatase